MIPGSTRVRRRLVLFVSLITAAFAVLSLAGATTASAADQQVSYLGLTFDVPASWPVVTLTPTTCVRFDRHAVYLGTPGATQDCPAKAVGRAEGLLVQPATGATTTTSTDDTVSQIITVTTPTATVTAPYAGDRATVAAVLASAGLPAATALSTAPPLFRPHAATAALPASATNGSGEGFDTCTAPSTAQMAAWMGNSPFTNVGIYLGGADTTCPAKSNLTAGWVSQVFAQGWHFLPIYLGHQAEFGDIGNAQVEGTQDADQAVSEAENLGFSPGSVLYYDMEGYSSDRGQAMVLEAAWTAELHRLGWLSGVYSSANSGISDLANNYGGTSTPDVVWTARYNGVADTSDAVLPAGDFANHQRAHQYQGGTSETFNNVTINIDSDYLDVGVSGEAIPPPVTGGLEPVSPDRLLDTRSAIGVSTTTPLAANSTLTLQVTGVDGVPGNVLAVVMNVTAVSPSGVSYLSVFPDGDSLPGVSNINFTGNQTVPNLVTVPVVDGAISIYNHVGSVHVLADLVGYYTASGGQTYHGVTPTRVLDTRNGTGAPQAPLGIHQSLNLTVTGGTQQIPANASAVIINVTAVNPTANSYLTVTPGQTVANLVTVPVTNGSIDIYNNNGTTDVVGDVMGYYTPDVSSQFTPTQPARLLDTRDGTGRNGQVGALGANGVLKLVVGGTDGIPANVDAVILNVTAVNATAGGYLSVYPDGVTRSTSNINFGPGQTVANLVIVPVVNGSVDIYNLAGNTDVTADVAGYYVG